MGIIKSFHGKNNNHGLRWRWYGPYLFNVHNIAQTPETPNEGKNISSSYLYLFNIKDSVPNINILHELVKNNRIKKTSIFFIITQIIDINNFEFFSSFPKFLVMECKLSYGKFFPPLH